MDTQTNTLTSTEEAEPSQLQANENESVQGESIQSESVTESENTPTDASAEDDIKGTDVSYEEMAQNDLQEIKRLFPSFSGISHLGEIERASRFGEMREAGFSVEEAFMATNYEKVFASVIKKARMANGKSHLTSTIPAASGSTDSGMTSEEMRAAKEMFSTLSEKEIQALYKRAKS